MSSSRTAQQARLMVAAVRDAQKVNWGDRYRPGDNLRITTRISKAACPMATRYLDTLPPERREQLEREWEEHAIDPRPTHDPITDEIKAIAAKEWSQSE